MNNDYIEDSLMHHGVQGQKWGVRRMKDKVSKEKAKTQIADLKAQQALSKKTEKQAKKSHGDIRREKVKDGKVATNQALLAIGKVAVTALILKGIITRGSKKAPLSKSK